MTPEPAIAQLTRMADPNALRRVIANALRRGARRLEDVRSFEAVGATGFLSRAARQAFEDAMPAALRRAEQAFRSLA